MRGGKFSIGNEPTFMQTLHMRGETKRLRQPQAQGFAAQNAAASKKNIVVAQLPKGVCSALAKSALRKKAAPHSTNYFVGKNRILFSPRAALQF